MTHATPRRTRGVWPRRGGPRRGPPRRFKYRRRYYWNRLGGKWFGAGVLAVAVAATAAVVLGQMGARASGPRCQNTFVPAFFSPGSAWAQAIASNPPPSHIILDVTNSGAGNAPDSGLQAEVKRARAAGITVLGYSTTDYGKRPAASVEADVLHYKQWYGVDGAFLDQAAYGAGELGYYAGVAGFVHREDPGGQVWLNPGVYPDPRYLSLANVVMVFEGPYHGYLHAQVPAWAGHYRADRFAHTVYAAPAARLAAAVRLSRSRHAGYLYLTDRSGANPYNGLPSYWAAEDDAIAAACPRS